MLDDVDEFANCKGCFAITCVLMVHKNNLLGRYLGTNYVVCDLSGTYIGTYLPPLCPMIHQLPATCVMNHGIVSCIYIRRPQYPPRFVASSHCLAPHTKPDTGARNRFGMWHLMAYCTNIKFVCLPTLSKDQSPWTSIYLPSPLFTYISEPQFTSMNFYLQHQPPIYLH